MDKSLRDIATQVLSKLKQKISSSNLRIEQISILQTSINRIHRTIASNALLPEAEQEQKIQFLLNDLNKLTLAYLKYSILEEIAEQFDKNFQEKPRNQEMQDHQQEDILMILDISSVGSDEFVVHSRSHNFGEAEGKSQYPYSEEAVIAIHKLLEYGSYESSRFSDSQIRILRAFGIITQQRLNEQFLAIIGQKLYKSLLSGQVEQQYHLLKMMVPNNARLRLQLHFDSKDVDLMRFPWELLHNGSLHLIRDDKVEITRYIKQVNQHQAIEAKKTLSLLYLLARPLGLWDDTNASLEREAILKDLKPNKHPTISIDVLSNATYTKSVEHIRDNNYQIVHFDGHGTYAKKCPECGVLNYPHLLDCGTCKCEINTIDPQGFLAFEDKVGNIDYVSTYDLAPVLLNSGVSLVYLSACQSALVREKQTFSGLTQALIRSGIPSVLGMQFSIELTSAAKFATTFYKNIVKYKSLRQALSESRLSLVRSNSWYIPTLYLHTTSDDELKLIY